MSTHWLMISRSLNCKESIANLLTDLPSLSPTFYSCSQNQKHAKADTIFLLFSENQQNSERSGEREKYLLLWIALWMNTTFEPRSVLVWWLLRVAITRKPRVQGCEWAPPTLIDCCDETKRKWNCKGLSSMFFRQNSSMAIRGYGWV